MAVSAIVREVFLDRFALIVILQLVLDFLLLWATSEVAKATTTPLRLWQGAFVGTAYYVVVALAKWGLLPFYRVWGSLVFALLISCVMLATTFRPRSIRRLLSLAGPFFAIFAAASGIATVTGFFIWGTYEQPNAIVRSIVAIGTVLAIAELGWGAVQKHLWQHVYQVGLSIEFDSQSITVPALVDTGNRLRDPLSGLPVVILEAEAMQDILPDSIRNTVLEMGDGDLAGISRLLASSTWSSRFRVIPFSSLGRENGLLIGFRPDAISVSVQEREVHIEHAMIGISGRRLDPDGQYQALLHPEIIQSALSLQDSSGEKHLSQGGESSHVTSHHEA